MKGRSISHIKQQLFYKVHNKNWNHSYSHIKYPKSTVFTLRRAYACLLTLRFGDKILFSFTLHCLYLNSNIFVSILSIPNEATQSARQLCTGDNVVRIIVTSEILVGIELWSTIEG